MRHKPKKRIWPWGDVTLIVMNREIYNSIDTSIAERQRLIESVVTHPWNPFYSPVIDNIKDLIK